jgi:hypothetical protein
MILGSLTWHLLRSSAMEARRSWQIQSISSQVLKGYIIIQTDIDTNIHKIISTWHIICNSPSSGWIPKSPDASRGTLPNRPFALCKNILWPRKHKLVDMFWNKIQKAQWVWVKNHILVSCSSIWTTFRKIADLYAYMNYTRVALYMFNPGHDVCLEFHIEWDVA